MIIYDVFRSVRIIIRHSWVVMGVEDVAYWIYAAIKTFTLLYTQNDGGLRWYAITGVFAGMCMYNIFISSFLLKFLKNVKRYFKMRIYRFNNRSKVGELNEKNSEIQKKKKR